MEMLLHITFPHCSTFIFLIQSLWESSANVFDVWWWVLCNLNFFICSWYFNSQDMSSLLLPWPPGDPSHPRAEKCSSHSSNVTHEPHELGLMLPQFLLDLENVEISGRSADQWGFWSKSKMAAAIANSRGRTDGVSWITMCAGRWRVYFSLAAGVCCAF